MVTDADYLTEFSGVIRRVLRAELEQVRAHLLRLDGDARRRRFGHDVADAYIHSYAATVTAPGNLAFGYFLNGRVGALAELKRPGAAWPPTAEAAFSVEREFANKGLATLLMGRIIRSARNRGIKHLLLYCMADNAKMRAIAQRYSADLRFEGGSVIADIVPRRPDYSSMTQEFIEDRLSFVQSLLRYASRAPRAN